MADSILVVLLFVGSGAAALIYEVVWQQLLQLVIGSSTVSLGVLLGTYMGGMCLGSLFGPRLLSRGQHPLRLYAWLEAKIEIPMTVSLCNARGLPVVNWRIARAIPVKLTAPSFEAAGNQLAIETLELLAGGISVEHV